MWRAEMEHGLNCLSASSGMCDHHVAMGVHVVEDEAVGCPCWRKAGQREQQDERERAMRYATIAVMVLLLGSTAWADARSEIPHAMADQAAAWNRGDVDAFMHWYLDSPQTTYTSSGQIVQGYAALRDRYVKKYGDSKESMGQLRFGDLTVTTLGREHALVLGRWYLQRAGQADLEGVFTLVWTLTPQGWRIISDHTSLRKD